MSHFSLPIVNVSAVGQTEFCPRAGLISHLRSEAGEEQGTFAFLRLPHLGYQPMFELAAIHRRLELHKEKATQGCILTMVVFLLGAASGCGWGLADWVLCDFADLPSRLLLPATSMVCVLNIGGCSVNAKSATTKVSTWIIV